ncbi:L,D-transpeptidase [Aquamicrobium sp. LC103]|uniref:L,D-transpeptidase n=1 Tax=Aquamicrobium sp. LC103 TaxID=1120658 RepID=UPI0009E28F1D|nr:L,D-transpeptidase [Aquamicrobium sp. LC103]
MKLCVCAALVFGALLVQPAAAQDDFWRPQISQPAAKPVKRAEPASRKNAAEVRPQTAARAQRPASPNENTGELRSEEAAVRTGLFGTVLGRQQGEMLPQTRALDAVYQGNAPNKRFQVRPDFEPQTVDFSGYKPGTIVINTQSRYLYLVESSSKARRYAIAVGREGLEFKGRATVGDKQEWPRWFPTKAMQEREPKKYGPYKDGMNGGPNNPLGARAIYLYDGRKDTHVRIHGTNQPQTIGTNSSNGCFRMVNEHVIDLYNRVRKGTEVVVL